MKIINIKLIVIIFASPNLNIQMDIIYDLLAQIHEPRPNLPNKAGSTLNRPPVIKLEYLYAFIE